MKLIKVKTCSVVFDGNDEKVVVPSEEIISIYCDNDQLEKTMGFLEKNEFVYRYVVHEPGVQTFTEQQLKYYWAGYYYPAGKLIDNLYK